MADLAQLEAALVKADAAGDADGARVLAGEVRKMREAKPAAAPSFLDKVRDFAVDKNAMLGLGETGATLATGALGQAAGGIAGLGQAATNAAGLTDTPAGDRVGQVAQAMTYQPRTTAGKTITGAVAAPFELLAKGADAAGGKITDVTGSPAAGAAVNTGIQSLPMLLGPAARALPGESAASIAARNALKTANAKTDAGIAAAREANLAITPTMAEAGITARTVEGLSGEPKMAKMASKKNAPVINEMIRKDVELPEGEQVSRESLAAVRKEAGQAYEFVKGTGRVATDAKFKADLHDITKSFDTAAKDFSHRSENPFKKTMDGLNKSEFDAASAVEEVKLLRGDADKAFGNKDKQLGSAFKKAAQAIDDQLDRHLRRIAIENGQDPAFATGVADYQAARTRIAKSYAADKALNDATGNIDAGVYAKALKDGKKLSGEAEKVGKFAQQFPRAAQKVEKAGNLDATFADVLLGVAGGIGGLAAHGAVGGGIALPLMVARPAARAAMLSDLGQGALTKPRTYGPSKIRRLQDLIGESTPEQAAAGTSAGQRGRR